MPSAQVHTEDELARVLEVPGIENHLLGINNRDLGTFKVDLGLTEKLMSSPAGQKVGMGSWGACYSCVSIEKGFCLLRLFATMQQGQLIVCCLGEC